MGKGLYNKDSEGKVKDDFIKIRVSKEHKQLIEQYAKMHGKKTSSFILEIIDKTMKN